MTISELLVSLFIGYAIRFLRIDEYVFNVSKKAVMDYIYKGEKQK